MSTDELDLCNRCLVQLDARVVPVAVKGDIRKPFEGNSIRQLIDWAWDQITSGFRIQVGATDRCFDPVSTWHGDPVCEPHLWWLRDWEMRDAREGRYLRR